MNLGQDKPKNPSNSHSWPLSGQKHTPSPRKAKLHAGWGVYPPQEPPRRRDPLSELRTAELSKFFWSLPEGRELRYLTRRPEIQAASRALAEVSHDDIEARLDAWFVDFQSGTVFANSPAVAGLLVALHLAKHKSTDETLLVFAESQPPEVRRLRQLAREILRRRSA